jgi:O-antigen/teichoic acid export membrane protein
VFIMGRAADYGQFFDSAPRIAIGVAGAAAWTLVNLLSAAFVSARRADGQLSLQTLVSLAKVMLVIAVASTGLGAAGIVDAWVGSALLGVAVGALWLIPSLRLGRSRARHFPVAPGKTGSGVTRSPVPGRSPVPERSPVLGRSRGRVLAQLVGQHLTSAGGAATPLLLPIVVFVRLGAVLNAYFYVTWMVGSVFFTISPSVSAALFAESVRVSTDLRAVVRRAFQLTTFLLIPVMAVMVCLGKLVLDLFGQAYADAGYWLLVVLAISAVPDAVSNIAVAVFRVTGRLHYSAALNLAILAVTVCCAWFLLPSLGVLGAGVAWLIAQALGAVASVPAYAGLGVTAEPST